jgi:alpha/beta superfamily hydrolase
MIPGPTGKLEALLEEPEYGAPVEAALVCHPHPAFGGSMHNKVVFRLARALRRAGAVVLRFNFRGVNQSEGSYSGGIGELEDARCALGWLRERYPKLSTTLAGFSFGAGIALQLALSPEGLRRVIAAGLPARFTTAVDLSNCLIPKIFIQSSHDEFGSVEELRSFVGQLPEPKSLHVIEAADHFFTGALDDLEGLVSTLDQKLSA